MYVYIYIYMCYGATKANVGRQDETEFKVRLGDVSSFGQELCCETQVLVVSPPTNSCGDFKGEC